MIEVNSIIPVIAIKKTREGAQIPTQGSAAAAGFDLYSCTDADITIEPGQTVKIDTGIAIAIPIGYFGGVYARSGIATKQGLRPANCTGVIDSDYRGSIIVALHNDSDDTQHIPNGTRIAQLIIQPCMNEVRFIETDFLDSTERSAGGFGSTGTN